MALSSTCTHRSWNDQQYYRETHNIHLKYPDIIGIALKGRERSIAVVPAELCRILPDQRYTRKLPQEHTKAMVEFTSEKPRARIESILRGIGSTSPTSVRASIVCRRISYLCRHRFSTTKTRLSSRRQASLSPSHQRQSRAAFSELPTWSTGPGRLPSYVRTSSVLPFA